jgi:protein-disulfide isomerase
MGGFMAMEDEQSKNREMQSGRGRKVVDVLFTTVILLCAVTCTLLVVRREFLGGVANASELTPPTSAPRYIADWKKSLETGSRMGLPNASLQIVEFADFECPYCRSIERILGAFRLRHPNDVAVTFVHFPLPSHRFAEDAARAAECAGQQEKFEEMHHQLFAKQTSFGVLPWSDFAKSASVPNLHKFDECMGSAELPMRIEAGQSLGDSFGVSGTPTVIVNGWLLSPPVNSGKLEELLLKAKNGQPLFNHVDNL